MWAAVAKGIGGAIVGEVAVNLALNTSGFNKDVSQSVKGAEKSYSSAFSNIERSGTNTFSKLGKLAATYFSARAIINFSKQALKLGSDLQEVQNVVDVTYGSMSNNVNEFASHAIETAGLSETVAKKYMGTFGAMNKQFGFTTEQSYEMSKAITQLTGDVASFYNLSTDEAYTKLKSIWTGETETLKEIGVVMTQNALDQYALANGYGKTTAKMTEQEKVALRYAFVQEKLSLASGDFVRTQDGWANQTRVLTLRWQQFMATVGQGLINMFTPIVKVLNIFISKLQVAANAFKQFTETIFGNSNSGGSSGVASTVTNINDGIGGIGTTASDTADKVSSAAKKMKRSLSSVDEINVISSNKDSANSDGSGISDAVLSASGIGALGETQLSQGLNENSEAISKFAEKVERLIKPLKEIDFTNLKNGLGKVKTALEPITKKLSDGLLWLWDEILVPVATWTIEDAVPAFLNAVAGALDFINGVMDVAKPYLQFLWENFLKPIASWTGGVIVDVLNGVGDGLSKVGKWLSEHAPSFSEFTKELEPFANLLSSAGTALGKILGLGWAVFTEVLKGVWEYGLKPIWTYLLKPILENHWSKVKGLAQILTGIFEAFNRLMEGDWKGAGESIVDGLTEGITTIWEGSFVKKYLYDPIVGGFKTLFGIHSPSTVFFTLGSNIVQGLINGIGSLVNNVKTIFTNLLSGIKNTWGTVSSWFNTNVISPISNFFGSMWNKATTGVNNAKTNILNAFNNIKNGITEKITSAKNTVGTMIEKIKGFFNFDWSLPKIKTPHIYWTSTPASGWISRTLDALGLPTSIPKMNVSWYAQGGWLKKNNPQLAVVGDNKTQNEIIAPENKIREQVKLAMQELGTAGQKFVMDLNLKIQTDDGRTLIKKINDVQVEDGYISLMV